MKIALFYPRNALAGWYAIGGYVSTLERMGHEVMDCPLPGNQVHAVEQVKQLLPTVTRINECDCALVMYTEYVQPWLKAVYGPQVWQLKVPVIARYDESFDRADLGLPRRWEEIKPWTDYHSFPAAQDAEKFSGQWLPFGADEHMFSDNIAFSKQELREKKYPLAFVGSLYQSRLDYLAQLAPCVGSDVTFHCGQVFVQDLSGIKAEESTRLLAENYRQIKVFFCLPPMSKLIVCKVFEIMACGTFVMFPRLPGEAAKNLTLFEDKKHIAYYNYGYMKENAEQIHYWLAHDKEREAVAQAGCKLVHEKYTLEQMLEQLLAPVADTCSTLLHIRQ